MHLVIIVVLLQSISQQKHTLVLGYLHISFVILIIWYPLFIEHYLLGQYLSFLVDWLPWQASWSWFCWNASWIIPLGYLFNLLRFGSKYNRQHLIKSVCSKKLLLCKTAMNKEIKTGLKTRRYVSKVCWILYSEIFLKISMVCCLFWAQYVPLLEKEKTHNTTILQQAQTMTQK